MINSLGETTSTPQTLKGGGQKGAIKTEKESSGCFVRRMAGSRIQSLGVWRLWILSIVSDELQYLYPPYLPCPVVGLRVQGSEFGVQGLECGVWSLGDGIGGLGAYRNALEGKASSLALLHLVFACV